MLADAPTEEIDAALDRCAADTLWEAGVDHAPVDAVWVAQRLGMVVAIDRRLDTRARFVRLATDRGGCGAEAILLADEPRPERRQWAVAHEIGEATADRLFFTLGVDPREASPQSRERVANALAGRLLLPRKWFLAAYHESDGDLFALKRAFVTASHELIARRALECVRAPLVATVYDHGLLTWRRWNLSGPAPRPLRTETDLQRRVHLRGEPAQGDGLDEPLAACGPPLSRARCWPVHETHWRREVLLSDLRGEESEWY